jgi:tetratricopeptide (TPR) repeat protein
MMFPFFSWLVVLLGLLLPTAAAEKSSLDEALRHYNAGSYEAARDGFQQLVSDGEISAALCHNLANAEYKLNRDAQAVLWYRRALALDPHLPEAQQNFRFLLKKHGFLNFTASSLEKFGSLLRRDQWRTWWQLAAWAVLIPIVWLVWLRPSPRGRWPLVAWLVAAAIALTIGIVGAIGNGSHPAPLVQRVVVISDKAAAYTAPAEAAATVISLPIGSEVFPRQTQGNWHYCDLPGGQEGAPLRGWIRVPFVEPLWPYAAALVE